MRNIWIIAVREYKTYFTSPVAYAVAAVTLGVVGIFFYLNLRVAETSPGFVPDMDAVFGPLAVMMILLTPAITTRLLAEERRLGTIELLLTAPVQDWELVVGKWLGGFMLLATLILITGLYPIVLNQLIEPGIDKGPILSGYLGIVLMAAAIVAVGVFISSLFSNQIAAFAATLGAMIFLWWILAPIAQYSGGATGSEVLGYLDFQRHYFDTLMRGVIDLRDIIYYISLTVLALFFGSVSVDVRRWG